METAADVFKCVLCNGHVTFYTLPTLNQNPYLILMNFLRQGLKRKLRMSGLSCVHSILTQAFRTHIHVTGSLEKNHVFNLVKFSNFFFRFKNASFASYGAYIGYQGLILTARSPTFQPCQNFQIIPVTFWVIGVLFDRGASAPHFWWYKIKVGVYLNDPCFWPNCPIFTKIFFFGRYELNEDTGTFILFVGPFLDFSWPKT